MKPRFNGQYGIGVWKRCVDCVFGGAQCKLVLFHAPVSSPQRACMSLGVTIFNSLREHPAVAERVDDQRSTLA